MDEIVLGTYIRLLILAIYRTSTFWDAESRREISHDIEQLKASSRRELEFDSGKTLK